MDNRTIDVTSEGDFSLRQAMSLAFVSHSVATHYRIGKMTKNTEYYANKVGNASHANCNGVSGVRIHHFTRESFSDDGIDTLCFYWTECTGALKLPFKMDAQKASEFASGWLSDIEWGREPDHDGSNGKGWRLFNDDWGHVGGSWQAIVAIQPAWAMYGK